MISYNNHLRDLSKDEQNNIDLVMIDGRFRVACCLKCYNIISDICLIVFDDFLDREQYHVVLKYFEIIDKTIDKRMVILKKKKHVVMSDDLIKKYELDRD